MSINYVGTKQDTMTCSDFNKNFIKKINEKIKPCPKCGCTKINFHRNFENFYYSCKQCKYNETVSMDYDSYTMTTTGVCLPSFSNALHEVALFTLLKCWNTRAELSPDLDRKYIKWNYNLEEAPYDKRIWILLDLRIQKKYVAEVFRKRLKDLYEYKDEKELDRDWYLTSSKKDNEPIEGKFGFWGKNPIAWCNFIEPKLPEYKINE